MTTSNNDTKTNDIVIDDEMNHAFAVRGGRATKKMYGSEHYKEMNKKSHEAKRRKKLKNQKLQEGNI